MTRGAHGYYCHFPRSLIDILLCYFQPYARCHSEEIFPFRWYHTAWRGREATCLEQHYTCTLQLSKDKLRWMREVCLISLSAIKFTKMTSYNPFRVKLWLWHSPILLEPVHPFFPPTHSVFSTVRTGTLEKVIGGEGLATGFPPRSFVLVVSFHDSRNFTIPVLTYLW